MQIYKTITTYLVLMTTILSADVNSFLEEDRANYENGLQEGYNALIYFGDESHCFKFEDHDFWEDMYPVWKNKSLWTIPRNNILSMNPAHIHHHLTTKKLLSNVIHNPSCKHYKQEKLSVMTQSERDVLFLMVHTYNMRSMVLLEEIQDIIETKGYGIAKKTAKSFIAGFITYAACQSVGIAVPSFTAAAVAMLWHDFGEILVEMPEIVIEVRDCIYEYLKYKYFGEKLELRLQAGVYPRY